MSKVPVISSPCPLRWESAPRVGMDFCGQCQRRVHNLDGMNDAQRRAFFESCSGEVCVAYTIKRAPAIAALGAAALGAIASVAVVAQEVIVNSPMSPHCDTIQDIVLTGGTTAGKDLQWIDESEANFPTKSDLPDIAASDWLPTPAEK